MAWSSVPTRSIKYEGAAILAGATPHYLPCLDNDGFNPDFASVPAAIWKRCQLLFLCSPGNPTGALVPPATLKKLIARPMSMTL